jgi:hypothetical protein
VFSDVSFGKLGIACSISESTDNEQSNDVLAFALDLTADASLKELEDHALLFPILEIVTDPDSICQVLCIKEALSIAVVENDIISALSNGFFDLLRS